MVETQIMLHMPQAAAIMNSAGMDFPSPSSTSTAARPEQITHAPPAPGRRWTDLGLVLLFPIVPSIAMSARLLWNSQAVQFTNPRLLAALFQELSALTLFGVLYFRQGRKLSGLGLGFLWSDLPKGLGLFFASVTAYSMASYCLIRAGFPGYNTLSSPNSSGMFTATTPWLLVPFLLLNPLFEEILVRGYLMTEIIELRSSAFLAVSVSLIVQTSYHLHYGIIGALSLGTGFAVFALYYARSRKLMPVIMAHVLWDFLGLIGAWHR